MNVMRRTADVIRWGQVTILLVLGLFGLLYLPDQFYQICARDPGLLPQFLGHAFAAWCIIFGWLLLIGSAIAQFWTAPWRLLLWAVVIAHNLTILWLPYWPMEPRPYLTPMFVLITSAWAAIFDAVSLRGKCLRR
jgi:hypothetical protein